MIPVNQEVNLIIRVDKKNNEVRMWVNGREVEVDLNNNSNWPTSFDTGSCDG